MTRPHSLQFASSMVALSIAACSSSPAADVASRVDAPLDAPGLDAPGFDVPGLDAPGLDVPGLDVPGLDAPALDAAACTTAADCTGTRPPACPGDAWSCNAGACTAVCDCSLDEDTLLTGRFAARIEDGRLFVDDVTDPAMPISVLDPTECDVSSGACHVVEEIDRRLLEVTTVIRDESDGVVGGVDLEITIANPTAETVAVAGLHQAALNVSGLDVGRRLAWRSLVRDSRQVTTDLAPTVEGEAPGWHTTSSLPSTGIGVYPDDLFSPVAVAHHVRGAREGATVAQYSLGVSALYDVLGTERHRLAFEWARGYGNPRAHLRISTAFGGAVDCAPDCGFSARLAPGQRWIVTLALRFVREPTAHENDWLRTLLPYRNRFRAVTGGVTYVRDPRPLASLVVVQGASITPDNPRGFAHSPRVDQPGGLAAVAARARDLHALGYPRVMMWSLAGLYSYNGAIENPLAEWHYANYPLLSFSPLVPGSAAFEPIFTDASEHLDALSSLATDDDITTGYYIGYAGAYHAHWNPSPRFGTCDTAGPRCGGTACRCVDHSDCAPEGRCNVPPPSTACASREDLEDIEVLSPYDACPARAEAHRAAQLAEIDAARRFGGTEIGMDAVVVMPLWDAAPWIRELRALYPEMHFTGETSPSDHFVAHAGSYLFGNGNVEGAPVLADFLLPGHETWAPLRTVSDPACSGSETDAAVIECRRAFAESIAALGYVVVPYDFWVDMTDDPSRYVAARSWIDSVPTDLRDPCAPAGLYER